MPNCLSRHFIPLPVLHPLRKRLWRWSVACGAVCVLVACGGGLVDSPSAAPLQPTASVDEVLSPLQVPLSVLAGATPDPDLLLLLLPDDPSPTDDRVTAWIDAAHEVGARMAVVTDAQFLAMGPVEARRYGGLVLPDQLHAVATDTIVSAVRDYTQQGGRTFLTFDFGALTLNGAQQPVYPIPRSRLSDLAGVDYVLYDELRDRTVGLGPVTAMRSMLRELLVPPGKSMPYPAPVARQVGLAVSNPAPSPAVTARVPVHPPTLLDRVGQGGNQALYLPVAVGDPGGVRGFDPQQFQNVPLPSLQERQQRGVSRVVPRQVPVQLGKAFKAPKVAQVSGTRPVRAPAADVFTPEGGAVASPVEKAQAVAPDALEAYHGYLLGHLIYPSYVTTGVFSGTPLATSPDFGLVAGVHAVGTGQVLFVNLPLGYLKGRTDALPMHGFLSYFVQHMLQSPRLSAMPNGVAGLTFDWHLDSMSAQAPSLALETAGVFNQGPFSMEMTAGPDAVVPGDGLGWNLNFNPVAQQLLQRMDALGHAVGSHGGWVHDHFGNFATEDNAAEFSPLLQWNQAAVDGAVGKPARSYSAPQGNNPLWAMDWLEQQGIEGAYFGGHTGLGATRQYRDGVLKNPALSVFPVTPQGMYATFEEFQIYQVPKTDVIDWYHALIDFSIAHNSSRLVYAHPPGANQWSDVLNNLLAYAAGKGAAFRWYTMPRLAKFMAQRRQVVWTESILATGATRFDVSHPTSLADMVWMLPKARYAKPVVVTAGGGSVVNGGTVWLVKAAGVTQLRFRALPNPTYVPA
ncbi:polysaccharide deacetylase family protein [Hydrogenophaga soli]